MFFKHSKKGFRSCDKKSCGIVDRFPESPVNPMYKPRTLSELKALFDHTGINPAPVAMRDGITEVEGLDAMDLLSIPIGGDTFEHIRVGKALESKLRDTELQYRESLKESEITEVEETQAE